MLQRASTFLVGTQQQRHNLAEFKKDERETVEATWQRKKDVALCFQSESYGDIHPQKVAMKATFADAVITTPMLTGVMDGVSQLEEYGYNPMDLPDALCRACEELAYQQLMPEEKSLHSKPKEIYKGPVSLLTDAYESTSALGSTTIMLCALDNMTKVHGKTHPMIAVLSIGDCGMLLLRRSAVNAPLERVFNTDMQRIGGHKQAPLQVARVDARIDEDFDEDIALEVIQEGSAVHCFTAHEGDVVIMGSDGVFDNLFTEEILSAVNENFVTPSSSSSAYTPQTSETLKKTCEAVVAAAMAKCDEDGRGLAPTPFGYGGKADDTTCVIGEVVAYTKYHADLIHRARRQRKLRKFYGCVQTACLPVTCIATVPCKVCCPAGESGGGGSCSKVKKEKKDEHGKSSSSSSSSSSTTAAGRPAPGGTDTVSDSFSNPLEVSSSSTAGEYGFDYNSYQPYSYSENPFLPASSSSYMIGGQNFFADDPGTSSSNDKREAALASSGQTGRGCCKSHPGATIDQAEEVLSQAASSPRYEYDFGDYLAPKKDSDPFTYQYTDPFATYVNPYASYRSPLDDYDWTQPGLLPDGLRSGVSRVDEKKSSCAVM
ncbi:unnamed protein product [Amoebophrya sp. A120]|nr:unnamed protein product [Amoebophrya sp. A120]|eukprot:GSA120T00007975001.1